MTQSEALLVVSTAAFTLNWNNWNFSSFIFFCLIMTLGIRPEKDKGHLNVKLGQTQSSAMIFLIDTKVREDWSNNP
jgi:hypothetical protein